MGGVAGFWQSSWFLCRKCGVLFRGDTDFAPFSAQPAPETAGSCAGGGAHDGQSGTRFAILVGDSGPNAQGGWHRCGKCSGIFLGPSGVGGRCPKDGQSHQADGGENLLATLDQGDSSAQSGWSWCVNCSGMFSNTSTASICPGANGSPHRPQSRWAILPPAQVINFAVPFDRSSFLPHGRACVSDAPVDFKLNTHSPLVWITLCSGNWISTPQSPWQLHFAGGASDMVASAQLSFRMSPGGGCIIETLVLILTPSGDKQLTSKFPAVSGLLPALALNLLSSPTPLPCANFFTGSFDDSEFGDGANNNGVGTIVSGPALGMQLWPKREDRIRLDVLIPGAKAVNFELDTQE
jgi:hypothetical protein